MRTLSLKLMRRACAGPCLLAVLAAAPATSAREPSPSRPPAARRIAPDWVIIPGHSVGPLQLGMSAQEVRALVGDPERTGLAWEYMSQGFAILFDHGGQTVGAILGGDTNTPDGRLAKLFVARTRDGIGMASDRAAVLKALGEPSSRRLDGEWENLRFPGLEVSLLHDRVRWLAVRRFVAGQ